METRRRIRKKRLIQFYLRSHQLSYMVGNIGLSLYRYNELLFQKCGFIEWISKSPCVHHSSFKENMNYMEAEVKIIIWLMKFPRYELRKEDAENLKLTGH